MSTQELHIELDILLQKINSSWNKDFIPQEYDLLLNKEIDKFIKQRANPLSNDKGLSVFDTIKRVQDLNSLIKTVPILPTPINQKQVMFVLPFDYLGYISSETSTYYKCDEISTTTTTVSNIIKSFKPIKNLQIPLSSLFDVSVTLTYRNKDENFVIATLFNLNYLPAQYLPQDNIQDYLKYFIYDNAISKVIKKSLKEVNKDAKELIEFSFNKEISKFELKSKEFFDIVYIVNNEIKDIYVSEEYSNLIIEESGFDSPVSIIDEEFKSFIKNSNLSKSTVEDVKGYLREKELILYFPKGAGIKELLLTYVCKPTQIDLLLNIDSELPDTILSEIVSKTAQSLKGIISSDTYEKFTRENTLIE